MDRFVTSTDGQRVHLTVAGSSAPALVFVHGWLGNGSWFDAQRDHLAGRFTVVEVDLPGHGRSDKTRTAWSASQYADDIAAACAGFDDVILVGHSMSGAYVCEAAPRIPQTRAVILVDTLKDLEQIMPPEQVAEVLAMYRRDFRGAVENVLPKYLYSTDTPPDVRARIQAEFLAADPALAVAVIEPLYRMDLRETARRVAVPVRAINADYTPTNAEANRRYFRDYAAEIVARAGHYPMLERPAEFTAALDRVLDQLTSPST
jgi:sigma-B regulation protein RsbQ